MSDLHPILAEQGNFRGFRPNGGGWPAQPWVPCFSGSGATLEVHFLDADSSEVAVHTYDLSATPVGAYGLTRSGSSFLADRPKTAVGFRAYARDADVSLGRGGTIEALSSGTFCDPAATLPDTVYEDWSFSWAILGGAYGWKIEAPSGTNAVTVAGGATAAKQDEVAGAIKGPGSPTIDSYTSTPISAAANTADQELVAAPGANKQIWVYGWGGTADTGAGSIAFQDEADTAISGVMPVAQNGGFCCAGSGNFAMPTFKVPTNKALEMDTVTCGFKGWLDYAIVSV